MFSNFDFLKKDFPVLYNFGIQAERYCYNDSNSCLMKLGMIGETIVNLMFTYDRIAPPDDNTAVKRIDTLYREGLLTQDLVDILHALRKTRNKAVHENYASVDEGKKLLQMSHSLCEWFMQTYGDRGYLHHEFVMPTEQSEEPIPDKTAEEAQEAELTAEAEQKAADAETISKEDRRKQATKAASQRQKSEAETRYMIDEQLRQVGWEADTENLRYSKGIRPEKGRNLAIAEWPTDSTAGNGGRADYALFVGLQLVAIVEAKAEHKDIPSVIDYQGKEYPRNIRAEDAVYQVGTWGDYKVPFTFATNGRPYLEQYKTKSGIWFLDLRDNANIPQAMRGWMSPEGIIERLERDISGGNKALEDELDFDVEQFNRQVITRPFNETVLAEIARDIDPENPEEQGKTLIYAVDDQHADMIVDVLKNIYSAYDVDNDAIMKITGSVGGGNPKKVQEAIKRFKNERYPSIAVTVDLLTTGIDVPEITTLVFMRRVKSRILFEQMLGRATRLCPSIHKTHFEIYDPVGVYAILTDEITKAWSGMSTRQYKNLKGLKKENLRDNMSTLELVLNMLAEATTTELSKTH